MGSSSENVMESSAMAVSGVLIVMLLLGAGVIWLQIFLSRKEEKWPGLILPVIALCISLIAVFSVAVFQTATAAGVKMIGENGVVIQEAGPDISGGARTMPASSLIYLVVSVFLLYNIPTAVLLAIYFGCKEKQRQRQALQKMRAQDLG